MSDKRFVCIGWGSLIWDQQELPVVGDWMNDGPMLPVEFGRESSDRRITLVICEGSRSVQTFWNFMNVADLATAVSRLAEREKISKRITTDIGWWDGATGDSFGAGDVEIVRWAKARQLDGIVWTNLPCGFAKTRGEMPSGSEIVAYLQKLSGKDHENAKKYFVKTPLQIDTHYRRLVKEEMGWS